MEKHNLANLFTIAAGIMFYTPAVIVYFRINNIKDPELLFVYPNYVYLHFFHHGLNFLWNIYHVINYFSKLKSMRVTIFRELKEMFA